MIENNPELIERFYKSLYRIRRTEEEIARIYPTDRIKSPVHLSIGQEAASVGVCEALQPDDVVFGTYRGHAMYLAKGGDLKKMIAELYGKITGCARGKGGSMHMIDIEHGIMGTSAIVGTTIPISVGYAYGLKYRGRDSVVVSFFGDGAADEGAFHEALSFAALKRLPVLFVCENNYYAIHSHHLERRHSDNLCERAGTYGMPSERIEDGDIFKIYESAGKYCERIRRGEGPAFLEIVTCRWREHVGPNDDFHLGYRKKEDVECWMENDELKRLRRMLNLNGQDRMEAEIEDEIRTAFDFAESSLFPDKSELHEHLFKE
jgi:TPP-dependent pyruvate/acetoin dehydrogenase alpha subunit